MKNTSKAKQHMPEMQPEVQENLDLTNPTLDVHLAQDPEQQREAEKYENPVPSREYIMKLLEESGKPMFTDEIQEALHVHDEERMEGVRRRLKAMVRDGQLLQNRKGAFGLIQRMDLTRGRVHAHPDGFGFLVPDVGGDDLFLPFREMQRVMHGDIVLAQVVDVDHRGRQIGAIIDVVERAHQQVVGKLIFEHGLAFVRSENKRITQDVLIPVDAMLGAKEGQLVIAEIIHPPTNRSSAVGHIKQILGDNMDPGVEIEAAIHGYNLPNTWSDALLAEVAALPDTVIESDLEGREDIRHLPLVTIDGDDSKDFDDAVYAAKRPDGSWRLIVAIADVAHYVKAGSALDEEAIKRGNSVYFPQRVIPMLPEKLSNELCSLNPHVDRLCMVADLSLNADGTVRRSRFYNGVMHSHARLTYNVVAKIVVDKDEAAREQHKELVKQLDGLYELYHALRALRTTRGAIDFDTVETKIIFDEDRKIDRIMPMERNDAHKLIEECMLLANESVAKHLSKAKLPTLYRLHESPPTEKLSALHHFLADFRLQLGGGDEPKALDYGNLIASIQEHPNKELIETVLLRSMAQATYSPKEGGHFGLAYEHYLHFTSPIRRYPDLMVHRGLKHLISKAKKTDWAWSEIQLEQLGQQCSTTERRADEAVRDATNWLKCEYLSHFIGDTFAGAISSVASFGVFVQLDHLFVEGLVHVTELGDEYFHFDPVKHLMLGERTGKLFRLGDRVAVQVASVNLDDRKIGFCFPKADKTITQNNELAGIPAPANPKKRRTNTKTRAPRHDDGFSSRHEPTKDAVEEIRALMLEDEVQTDAGETKAPAKKKRRRNNNRRRREPAA
jgi:ribonuclease R